jgi:transcriptional regulator with XRE-family HTH domain
MTRSLTEAVTSTPEGMRLYQQERAIVEATELICEIMEEDGISKSQLAEQLGKSRSYVTQLLDGRTNMTIRTMSDVFCVLNRSLHFQDGRLSATVAQAPVLRVDFEATWQESTTRWVPHYIPEVSTASSDRLAG